MAEERAGTGVGAGRPVRSVALGLLVSTVLLVAIGILAWRMYRTGRADGWLPMGVCIAAAVVALLLTWLQVLRMLRRHVREQARTDRMLRRSREELSALVSAMSDVILVLDAEGRYVDIPHTSTPLLYRPPQELIGRRMHEVLPSEAADLFLGQVHRALETGTAQYIDYDLPVGGRVVRFHGSVSPMSDDRVVWVARDVTALKEAREEADAHRAYLRAVIDASPSLVIAKDAEGRFTLVNRAAAELYGTDPAEMVGRTDAELVDDPEVIARFRAQDRAVLETGESIVIPEEPFADPRTGEVRWFQTRKARLTPPDGGPPEVLAVISDITELKRVEERERQLFRVEAAQMEAQAAHARIAAILESITDAFFAVDAECRITYVNHRAETIFGHTRDELLGRELWEELPGLADTAVAARLRQALTLRHPAELEVYYPPADAWYEAHVYPAMEGSSVYFHDITARHRAEERLRRQTELVKLLQRAAVAANEARSMEEALAEVVAEVCRRLRFPVGHALITVEGSPEELRATGIWHLEDDERYEPFVRATHAVRFRPGVCVPGRVLESGEPAWISDAVTAPEFRRTEVARAVGLHADISFPVKLGERTVAVLEFLSGKALEPDEELLETMSNVGTQLGRAFERTRATEAVLRARDEAERASRAKSEFLSRMSHELRTPMNAILGFSQLLAVDLEREEDQESVEQILRAGRHLLSLIDEVLDLARIEADRITLSLEPVSVSGIVRDALGLIQPLARQRGIELTQAECAGFARADHQRLQQVLLNLLSNAVKYNREGGSVTVSCAEIDADRLRISVRDTGPGISPEEMEQIFVPFDRLGAERRGIEGTGLGLALSKGLVEAMGGELGVESVVGEGATFYVELPRVDPPPRPHRLEGGEAAASPDAHSAPRTVLYVEDNLSNLRLVERLLARRPNINLLAAMQGSLGIDLARQHHPDLILLDLHLPDLGGDEVLERLLGDPETSGIPLVVISADASPTRVKRVLASGARAFLTKPLDVKRLLEVMDENLSTMRI